MYSIEEIIHTPCYFFLHFAKDHLWNFPAVLNVKSDFLLINLWTSASSLGTLETLQCRSAVPNIKYNCALLFLSEMYWLFMHVSKYFLIDGYCKTSVRNMCNSRLMFLQGEIPKEICFSARNVVNTEFYTVLYSTLQYNAILYYTILHFLHTKWSFYFTQVAKICLYLHFDLQYCHRRWLHI